MRRSGLVALTLVLVTSCRESAPTDAALVPPRKATDATATRYDSQEGQFEVTELVAGLQHPWGFVFLPDGGMLVTERPGRLRRIGTDGRVSDPIAGLPKIFVEGQGGLLDVALSPAFASDAMVYLSFAEPSFRGNVASTAVLRGRLQGGSLHDVEIVYRQEPKLSAGTHLGSRLVFDDAGHLFVTQGDNRVAAAASQELGKLQGKLVRIWPDGRIPQDNPFVGRAQARPEIWSYGHRNMQGAALHPVTRTLWTSEHGPMGGDELNLPMAGRNYGWPVITHGRDYNGKPVPGSKGSSARGMEQPHHVWPVSPGLSGMTFYTGDLFPRWKGDLFLGALATGELIRLDLDGNKVLGDERLLKERGQRMRDVRQGPDGALYLLVDDPVDGKLLRLAPVAAGVTAHPGAGGTVPGTPH